MLKKWVENNIKVEKLAEGKVAITAFEVYSESEIHYGLDGSFIVPFKLGKTTKDISMNRKTLDKFAWDEVGAIHWFLVDMFVESSDSYKDMLAAFFPIFKGGWKFYTDTKELLVPETIVVKETETIKEYIKVIDEPRINPKKLTKKLVKLQESLNSLIEEVK